MKLLLLSLTCAALTVSASAQIFRPQTARNVLIGGVAGAIIGEHNDHRAVEGAAIGAAAGYVWSLATEPRRECSSPVPVVCAPAREEQVVVVPARCAPPVRTVIVERPVVVRSCPPPPVVVYREVRGDRHGRHDRPAHVVRVVPADSCGPREYVAYDRPVYRR